MKAVSYDIAGYDAFRERASDPQLSPNEKAGFPDSYREGRSRQIFADICAKLPSLTVPGTGFLDIGSGCGELGRYIAEACGALQIRHTIIDSPEMLHQIADGPYLTKISGRFPACIRGGAIGPFDAILIYSVIQYVFVEGNVFDFIDSAIKLLGHSGALLIGDIPNASMRKRFLAGPNAREYHRQNYPGHPEPKVEFNVLEPAQIDDAVILGLLGRARAAGLHAFVLPQGPELPMANRREDILVKRP